MQRILAKLHGFAPTTRLAGGAALVCAISVALAAAAQDASDDFAGERLGPADPAAVFDASIEQDAALRGNDGLVNFIEFREVLTRADLAAHLAESRAPIAVRLAVWRCAVERWPSFVQTLSNRRAALRDEMLKSSREWGLQLDQAGAPEPRLKSQHSRLVVRIQAERAAAEVRFLADLADCASTALSIQLGTADGARAASADLPADLLESLVQRAKLRNTSESILGRPPRWMGIDPRTILKKCEPANVDWRAIDDLLRAFEASRTTLLLARYRAEWEALGHDEAQRRDAWRRVELLERRVRQETRSALRGIFGSLDEDTGERLFLAAAAECYPELAEQLRKVARATSRTAVANVQGESASKILAWREDAIAITRRTVEELDASGEQPGFLWVRSGNQSLEESLELARARLDSIMRSKP